MLDTLRGLRANLPEINNRLAVPLALFVFVSSVYFATVTGVTASNDGSQYAAARTFAANGRFDVAQYLSFTERLDYAIDRYGVVHSDRPPATGLAASVVYRLGEHLPEPFTQVPSPHDGHNPRVVYGVLASVLAGSATVVLFYTLLRDHFDVSLAAALLAALALAFSTATWKYSTALYAHSFASLCIFASLHILFRAEKRDHFTPGETFWLGLALGASVLFEYTNAILVAIVLFYLAARWSRTLLSDLRDDTRRKPWLAVLGAGAAGSLIPAAFFIAFNVIFFGGPFDLSAYAVDPVRWACCLTLAGNFQNPILNGMAGFLFYENDNQGLFLLTPVSVLALLGWRATFRLARARLILVLGIFMAFFVLFSMGSTVNPGSDDGRYLVPFLGLWFVPFAVWLDQIYLRLENELPRTLLSLLLFGLLFLSVRNMAAHIAFSWGYDLNLADLENRSTPPYNLSLLGHTLFPNTRNVPLLWLAEAITLAAVWGYVALRRKLAPRWRLLLTAGVALLCVGYALAPVAKGLAAPPGMTPLDLDYGEGLHLVGYQLAQWNADFSPGDPVFVRLYWRVDQPASDAREVALALIAGEGELWATTQASLGNATFREMPLDTWPVGRIVQEEYILEGATQPPYGLVTDLRVSVDGNSHTLLALRPATLWVEAAPQYPLDTTFEGLAHLTGYDVEVLPYHRLAVTLHWQVTGQTNSLYTLFVHVVAPDGTNAAQVDRQPFAGNYPTVAWRPGESLSDTSVIQLGRNFAPGTYTLRIGLYETESGQRLPAIGPDGQPVFDGVIVLGEVTLP